MSDFTPAVFWLTGLSGAGKTTLGIELANQLRRRNYPVVLLDGDIMREVFGDIGHDKESRLAASLKYSRLCKILVEQDICVICSTISMFHKTQHWNRQHIENYIEVFIDVPMDELMKRDSKEIYSRAQAGELKNIVGIDIMPELPLKPDITIQGFTSVEDNARSILNKYDTLVLTASA